VAGLVALQIDVAEGLGLREAGDFRHEPEAPRLAPELAVGHHLEPELLLPADQPHDVLVDVAALQHLPRAQEAADMLGAVRWLAHQSIIASARSTSSSGMRMPSAFAVLRLITSSSFVGCSNGRSPGFVPLRILSMNFAAPR